MFNPFRYIRSGDEQLIWQLPDGWFYDQIFLEKLERRRQALTFMKEVKLMGAAKKNVKVTGPRAKKNGDVSKWHNPYLPVAERREFVDKCERDHEFFSETLWAGVCRCTGLTIKAQPDGSFTGYVFFSVGDGSVKQIHAVRSDALEARYVLLGLLHKFVYALECGELVDLFTEEEDDALFT